MKDAKKAAAKEGEGVKLRYVSSGLYPAYQERFADRVASELGVCLDLSTYRVTRGRGWSLSDGSFGSSVCDWWGKRYLLADKMARMVKSKKRLYVWHCSRTGESIIGLDKEG